MTSCGWIWLYLGGALMFLELASSGFVIFFFGLSAATVGALRLGIGEPFGSVWQVASFSVFTILYLTILRRWFRRLFSGEVSRTETDFNNDYVGRTGVVVTAIEPPLTGRVEIGDAVWTAKAGRAIEAGTTVRVVAVDNLTLTVEEVK